MELAIPVENTRNGQNHASKLEGHHKRNQPWNSGGAESSHGRSLTHGGLELANSIKNTENGQHYASGLATKESKNQTWTYRGRWFQPRLSLTPVKFKPKTKVCGITDWTNTQGKGLDCYNTIKNGFTRIYGLFRKVTSFTKQELKFKFNHPRCAFISKGHKLYQTKVKI